MNSNTNSTNNAETETLKQHILHYGAILRAAQDRAARYKDLLQRKSAKKWSSQKTARNVRRYTSAAQIVTELEPIIDQMMFRVSQINA